MAWSVVHFIKENSVEVTPNSWIVKSVNNDKVECFWPSRYTKTKIFNAVLSQESPGCDWKIYEIKILGTYNDYNIAQLKCNKAQENDVLTTETEDDERTKQDFTQLGRGLRVKFKNKVFNNNSSSDSEGGIELSDSSEPLNYPKYPSGKSLLNVQQKDQKSSTTKQMRKNVSEICQSQERTAENNILDEENENLDTFVVRESEQIFDCYSETNAWFANENSQNKKKSKNLKEKNKHDDIPKQQSHSVDRHGEKDQELKNGVARNQEKLKKNGMLEEGACALMEPLCQHGNDKSVVTKGELKEFHRQIMKQFLIQNRLKDIQDTLGELVISRQNDNNELNAAEAGSDLMTKFPLKTDDELQLFQECLENEIEKKNLAKALSLIGGETAKILTKKIMFRIFSNELGSKFSWEGQKGKRPFKNLKIAEVILQAVRIHFNSATEAEVIKVMREWLVRAKFRNKAE